MACGQQGVALAVSNANRIGPSSPEAEDTQRVTRKRRRVADHPGYAAADGSKESYPKVKQRNNRRSVFVWWT